MPASSDLVPLAQGGGNAAVTYSQFMSGLAGIGNVDVSQLLVTPTGGTSPTRLGDLAANTLPLTGGTLTGALTLAADPAMSLQSATKKIRRCAGRDGAAEDGWHAIGAPCP